MAYRLQYSKTMRYLIKMYLRSLTKFDRDCRLIFVGKRLKHKQYMWLNDRLHPWEVYNKEED